MRIISFVTQKGGAGKTTLAVNCAVAAEQAGRKTLILDLDAQASAEGWYQDREAETPRLVAHRFLEAARGARRGQVGGFDLVMIDTPGTRRAVDHRRHAGGRLLSSSPAARPPSI